MYGQGVFNEYPSTVMNGNIKRTKIKKKMKFRSRKNKKIGEKKEMKGMKMKLRRSSLQRAEGQTPTKDEDKEQQEIRTKK